MGYTNYWRFLKTDKKTELKYYEALECIHDWINFSKTQGELPRLSGVTPHASFSRYSYIDFNGTKDEGMCENFYLPSDFKENFRDKGSLFGFGFAKTRGYNYDFAVKGALLILKSYLGKTVSVSSDCDFFENKSSLKDEIEFFIKIRQKAIDEMRKNKVA